MTADDTPLARRRWHVGTSPASITIGDRTYVDEAELRARIAEEVEREARFHATVVGETTEAPATNNPTQRGRDEGIQIGYRHAVEVIRGEA